MIKIKTSGGFKVIQEDVEYVLRKFREFAELNDLKCYKDIKHNGSELFVTCPNHQHKNMQENTPSCSVAKIEKPSGRGGTVLPGHHYCYACKYSAPLEEVLSQIMGLDDGGEYGRKWLIDNFIATDEEVRDLNLDLDRNTYVPDNRLVTEEELDRLRFSHSYWAKRGISENTCIRFDLGFDIQQNAITMPIWDLNGKCIGVARRCVHKKVFDLPTGKKPVYLLNFAVKEHWREIYLCESQINALYLNELGYNACACFGTGTAEQAEQIRRSGVRSVVICFDGDKAGRIGREKMHNFLKKNILCSYIDLPDGYDINDYAPDEVRNILENFVKNF